jgi:hypothetical protein
MFLRRLYQPIACTLGLHESPSTRIPPGPVVADCPCCGKTVYYYGLSLYGIPPYPVLNLPNFPRVLGPLSAQKILSE